MRNLLNFLARHSNLIIFLILEGLGVYLLASGNHYHNSRIVKGINGLTNGIESRISNVRNYWHLREINESLSEENALLRNRLGSIIKTKDSLFFSMYDTVYNQHYINVPAEVINNTVNRQKNYFTLNKGTNQGVNIGMAVSSGDCVSGIVVGSSGNYSVAMSLLNLDFRLSARIRSNDYLGSLSWDGVDIGHAVLNEIPQHVTLNVGDTVETTGYSAIFPEGIIVGTIYDFQKIGGSFYKIDVLLSTAFRKLHFVNVIGNMEKEEQHNLENSFR